MNVVTLGQLATALGLPLWKVQRLVSAGVIVGAMWVGPTRVVARDQVDSIREKLEQSGHLPYRPRCGDALPATALV
jgi:hypothetical protein